MGEFKRVYRGVENDKAFSGIWDVETLSNVWFQSRHPQLLESLAEDGYAVFDFPEPQIDKMNAAIKQDFQFSFRNERNVEDAWDRCAAVRAIACNEKVLAILSNLYGRPAFPYHTRNFRKGSEIYLHCDALHADSLPRGSRATVLVALEDIDSANGPVIVYPGSHKWPLPTKVEIGARCMNAKHQKENEFLYSRFWEDRIRAEGVVPRELQLRKGQGAIWAANLLHSGSPILVKSRTRWSQVTHYYFDGTQYFRPIRSELSENIFCYKKPENILTADIRSIKTIRMLATAIIAGCWRQVRRLI